MTDNEKLRTIKQWIDEAISQGNKTVLVMAIKSILLEKGEDESKKKHFRKCMKCTDGTYQSGFKDGYNKANEWHYLKDVKPKDNEYVLIYTDLNNCYVAKKVENHFMSKGWGFIPMSTVIAWKEIVLPELKESK